MEKEVFKDVLGYEGLYQVSNYGRVKSLERKNIFYCGLRKEYLERPVKGKFLKIRNGVHGYQVTCLTKNGVCKNKFIHRLVAEAFIPNLENKPQVNHIDGNKQNNNIKNLEWCSPKENSNHAFKTGLSKKVKCITTNEIFISITEASKKYNLFDGDISRCCQGKRSHCGKSKTGEKLVWKYL